MDISPGSSTVYGLPVKQDFTLVCSGIITSSIPHQKLHLEDSVCVEWSDKNGPLQNLENTTVGDVVYGSGGVFTSTLLFRSLSPGHDRLYTCSMTLDTPATVTSDTAAYRVVLGKELLLATTIIIVKSLY